ncbi:hypothetical protein KSX_60690 [Ktedonospora formicarum]|uniref:Uncharacterized protein n=1 Tax=Ktedonospora formicarum TaxID=2778364 RepID=A0A8J3MVG1_9CHLR|nr:hypothetical protein KSX_60690 [Ktedonospora formicarum]
MGARKERSTIHIHVIFRDEHSNKGVSAKAIDETYEESPKKRKLDLSRSTYDDSPRKEKESRHYDKMQYRSEDAVYNIIRKWCSKHEHKKY